MKKSEQRVLMGGSGLCVVRLNWKVVIKKITFELIKTEWRSGSKSDKCIEDTHHRRGEEQVQRP